MSESQIPAAETRTGYVDGRQSAAALAVARGARRLWRALDYATVTELPLGNGRRADVVALGGDGRLVIVEVKSCLADYRADHKWPDYFDYCDAFYFAIPPSLDPAVIPAEAGLIIADAYGATVEREPDARKMHGSRRRATLLAFARTAADRLHRLDDPDCGQAL